MQTSNSEAIKSIQVAGYHDNIKDFARVCEQSKIPRNVADNAWHAGKKQRMRGNPCSCYLCSRVD